MEQPCALTTNVSQVSEKGDPGSKLVTTIGRLIGTLELRRTVSVAFALCIGVPLLTRARRAASLNLCTNKGNARFAIKLCSCSTFRGAPSGGNVTLPS